MQKYLLAITLYFLIGIFTKLEAQTPSWVTTMGGNSQDEGASITTDVAGNVYTCGRFSGTVDFDYGPGVFNLNSNGITDIYLTKYSISGQFIWAIAMGGNALDGAFSVKINNANDVILTGYIRNTVDMDPGPGVYNLYGVSNQGVDPGFGGDLFLAKYTSAGAFVWAFSVENDYWQCAGRGIAIDDADNIYLTGHNNATSVTPSDFDPGPGVAVLSGASKGHGFLAKYTSNGNYIWGFTLGGYGLNSAMVGVEIVPNDTTVIITGHVRGANFDVDPGPGTAILNAQVEDMFAGRYSLNGAYIWGFNCGGPGIDVARFNTIDSNGNFYTTGVFSNTVDFDPGPATANFTSAGNYDAFLSKYDINGNYKWTKIYGSNGVDHPWDLGYKNGQVISVGYFNGTVDFDPGAAIYNLTSAGSDDAYITQIDTAGSFICAARFGGAQSEQLWGMKYINNDSILISGYYGSNNMDVDPTAGMVLRTNAGNADIIFGKYYFQSNANYTATVTGDTICSGENPVLTLNLTPNFGGNFSVTITDGVNTYTANNVSDNVPFILNATPTANTTYTILYISNLNPSSCTAGNIQINIPVTVVVFPAAIILANATPPSLCSGEQTTLTGSGGISYNWSGGISNGVAFIPSATSTYTVIGTDANGCTNTSAVTVTVHQTNPITITPTDPTLCLGDSVQLTASGANNYIWSNIPGLNIYSGSTVWAFPNVNTTFTVTGTDANGCTSTASVTIYITTGIDVQITKNRDAECNINIVQLQATGAQNYSWTPANLLSNPNAALTNATVMQTTTFYLTGNTGSCVDMDSIIVYYYNNDETGIIIPNAFSPNGDGINDCLKVIQNANFKEYYFTIYNRWGERVFETDDPLACWNGEHKNKPAQMETYGYFLKAETICGKIFKKGDITLVR